MKDRCGDYNMCLTGVIMYNSDIRLNWEIPK